MTHIADYPFTVRPLLVEEGGGFLVSFPDLPGCMSDGETIEEAMVNAEDSLNCWVEAQEAAKKLVPLPNSAKQQPAKFVTRLPKSLHARLISYAKKEGVSVNS